MILFHSTSWVLFTFPHGTGSIIGSLVFSLADGLRPDSDRISRVPPYSGVLCLSQSLISVGLSPLCLTFHVIPHDPLSDFSMMILLPPIYKIGFGLFPSLAASSENHSYFLFCRYLDVSVPCVSPHHVYVFDM